MDETLEDDVEETSLSEVEETATTLNWAERRPHEKRRDTYLGKEGRSPL